MDTITLRRTWAEIDLEALAHNYQQIRNHIPSATKFCGVVKADAYGHGAVQVATKLEALGADYLAVATFEEAKELRLNGIKCPILVLGHTPIELTKALIEYDITQAVASQAKAEAFSSAAVTCGKTLKVHIKVDSGMTRIGFRLFGKQEETINAIEKACRLPNLYAEGIFTHFAVSDEASAESVAYTKTQLSAFKQAILELETRNVSFEIRHCANSGAIASHKEAHMDMVRAGIILYGAGDGAKALNMKSVMKLKTCIYDIRTIEQGADIGYGRTFSAKKPLRIGVLPVGYADGLDRNGSNRLRVWTKQGSVPIVGRICMDMTMVDLTAVQDVREGDEVEIFGVHQTVNEVANIVGTIPHTPLCAVSKRVPRVYKAQE